MDVFKPKVIFGTLLLQDGKITMVVNNPQPLTVEDFRDETKQNDIKTKASA